MGLRSRLRGLTLGDYARLFAAATLLLVARVGLALWSLSGLRGLLIRLAILGRGTVPGVPAPKRITAAVEVADERVPGSRTCLMRSLTSETLLVLYGHEPTHYIGVDKDDEAFWAHSWIEHDGEVLIGGKGDLSEFERLAKLDERESL